MSDEWPPARILAASVAGYYALVGAIGSTAFNRINIVLLCIVAAVLTFWWTPSKTLTCEALCSTSDESEKSDDDE